MHNPAAFYATAPDAVRRDLNLASFEKLWIEEDGVRADEKTAPVQELHEAAQAYRAAKSQRVVRRTRTARSGKPFQHEDRRIQGDGGQTTETYLLADLFRAGSSKKVLVQFYSCARTHFSTKV